MVFDVYNTHMELYPYVKDDYPVIENMYTAIDNFTKKDIACGYLIDNNKLYLPRGTSISKVESITDVTANIIEDSDPFEKIGKNFYSLYDPRDKLQEDSIKFLMDEEGHQLGLNLFMGKGKAEPLYRKIPTPTTNGWTRMGDLKVGDYVFDENGFPTEVIGVYPQGTKDIYKITFNDGRIALCCDEHLWRVKTYKSGKYHTMNLSSLYKKFLEYKDKYIREHKTGDILFNHYIPASKVAQYPHRDVPIDPYVLGSLIGNGCLMEYPLSISSGIEYIPDMIGKYCGFIPKRSSDKNHTYIFYDKHNDMKRVSTKEFFKDLPEMIGANSYSKHIPDVYIYNDYETRIRLLQGLMDTDGCISYNEGRFHITYSSCSKVLLKQIQTIIFSLGYRGTISLDKRNDKYKYGYHGILHMNIPNQEKYKLFTLSYKADLAYKAKYVQQEDFYSDLKISDIRFIKNEECKCIMVKNPNHLYLTEDFIVTHNTFCVAYASTMLKIKTLIITPNEGLKEQWIRTYYKMFDYRPKNLLNISGSNVMDALVEDLIDPSDIYFVNHQTLRSYLSQYNGYALHKFFKKLNVGIKVYDEAHMEFGNILLMDFFSNTDKTWYLTATFDRSDKSESVCFKRAFSSVVTFGEIESSESIEKHVIYNIVNINSHASPKDKARINGFSGMTSISYGRYAFSEDINQTAYESIKIILEKVKDLEGKVLVFVPLIDAADDVVAKIKNDFPTKKVSAYHSRISKEDKEIAIEKDIIVSTIKSCGTGKDIPGLRVVISAEPLASKVLAKQMFGRLRPYGKDKNTFFYDLIDISITPCIWWFKSRFKVIEPLAKEVIYLNIEQ